jgi:hypothetical protein
LYPLQGAAQAEVLELLQRKSCKRGLLRRLCRSLEPG